MTAPVFHAGPDLLTTAAAGDRLELTGAEARHAVTVRRLRAGEALDLVDGAGTRAQCELLRGEKDTLTVTVHRLHREPAPTPRLTLVQALAKGDRDLQAVQSATELGVDRVIPWQAERAVVRLKPERAARTMAKWDATLTAAAKQSRRSHWPELAAPVTTTALAELIAAEPDTRWYVLHESGTRGWHEHDAAEWAAATSLAVIVGPEGGIGDAETARLTTAGAEVLTLGPLVLRSSTAGPAALAALSAVTGRWG